MSFTRRLHFKSKPLFVKLLLWVLLAVSSVAALFLTISYVVIPLHIALSPSLTPGFYELGLYGGSPSQTYISNGLTSPRISARTGAGLCRNGYTFINFNGASVPRPGPAILNDNNELIWKAEEFGTTTNLKVYTYRGEQYMTFWSGNKGGTMGKGVYYMVIG